MWMAKYSTAPTAASGLMGPEYVGACRDSAVTAEATSCRTNDGTTRVLLSGRGFEQFDRVPVGVLDLDLSAARTGFHLIPERQPGVLQRVDECRQIGDLQDHAVPAARFLALAVRHRPRSRRARTAEQNVSVAKRDARKGGELLVFELESQMLGVKRDGPSDIFHLITDPVHALDEGVPLSMT